MAPSKIIRTICAAAAAIASAASPLTVCAEPTASAASDNAEFDAFLRNEFKEAMESDYMTMHYTVKDYASYGIEKPQADLGSADLESYQDAVEEMDESLKKLESFDYDSLSVSQQHDYDAYKFYLETSKDLNSYPMMDQIFSPGSGLQDNLLTNFTEFVFYNQQDVEDYLSVLEDVPEYLEEAIDVTKQQAAQGQFLTDTALSDTQDSIKKFTDKTDDNQLIVIFDEAMDQADFLSDSQKEDYKARNRDIVLNQYIPAYKNLSEELGKLKGSRKYEGGYVNEGKDGLAFYTAMVRSKTSSSDSIKDLFDLCNEFIDDALQEYMVLYRENPDLEDAFDSETVDYDTPEKILTYLQSQMEDFPQGPKVTYTPSYLDSSVANDTIMAYYMQPPIDDITDNVIKINGDSIKDTNTLYETLAHEGFPGHLYQITWYLNTNPNPIRAVAGSIGYTEGWGMYAEMDAWDHSGLDDAVNTMHKLETAIGYVQNAAADLAVNGLGYSEKQLSDWLRQMGFESSSASSLYEYCVDNPGLILPYGVGLAKFMMLRAQTRDQMGSDFDIREFNTVLLTYGDRPFDVVENDINAWVKKQGHAGLDFSGKSNDKDSGHGSDSEDIHTLQTTVKGIMIVLVVIAALAAGALGHMRRHDPFA